MSEPLGDVQDTSYGGGFQDDLPALEDMPSFSNQSISRARDEEDDAGAGDTIALVADLTPRGDTTADGKLGDDTLAADDEEEEEDADITVGRKDDGYETMTESESEDDRPADATRVKAKSRVVLKQRLVRKKKIR